MGVYSKRMKLEPCQVSNIKLIQMNHKLGYKKQSLKLQGRRKRGGAETHDVQLVSDSQRESSQIGLHENVKSCRVSGGAHL